MNRPTWSEFEARCRKPGPPLLGNWYARKVARPIALRLTFFLAPWGVSAHVVTAAAMGLAAAAALGFSWGTKSGWALGALFLQAWYVLDHVDGQVARYRGTASLDGVQLDYLMHHFVNLIVPIGVGWGLFAATASPMWLAAGLVWGVGELFLGLVNDTRYKSFIQRLKAGEGEWRVAAGAGGRPQPSPAMPRRLVPWARFAARKACEPHVVMNALTLLAAVECLAGGPDFVASPFYVAGMAVLSVVLAAAGIVRSVARGEAEGEFARWYQPVSGVGEAEGWTCRVDARSEAPEHSPSSMLVKRDTATHWW
jgi:hypothetical protein